MYTCQFCSKRYVHRPSLCRHQQICSKRPVETTTLANRQPAIETQSSSSHDPNALVITLIRDTAQSPPKKKLRRLTYAAPSQWPHELPPLDPLHPPDNVIIQYPASIRKVVRENWNMMRTRRINKMLQNIYVIRLLEPSQISQIESHLCSIFKHENRTVKLEAAIGFILRNRRTGKQKYHYGSKNTQILDILGQGEDYNPCHASCCVAVQISSLEELANKVLKFFNHS